jgi:DNA-binding NarL/FixJ family response regulator
MKKPVTLLVVDDHELVRSGIRTTLSIREDWQVVAEAANGREAVRLADRHRPQVVIMDIAMPEMNGLESTRQIRQVQPETKILILTVYDSEQIVREVLNAGADGYLLKSDAGRDLLTAVEAVLGGKPFFTTSVARLVLDGFLRSPGHSHTHRDSTERLSPREREVVQLLAEGRTSKQVATAMGISPRTAETHRKNLMQKLGCHSVADLVRFAIRNRIIEP